MSDKKPRKPRVTTEATKAKLPRPKRKRPHGSAPKRVQCPRCEKLVPSAPHDIHTCYDAKALREAEARAIPCGEDVTLPPDVYEGAMMFSDTEQYVRLRGVWHKMPFERENITPVTEPYPWPVRVLNWLDDAPSKARNALARTLRSLAAKVEP